jgi:hypothetical protein
MAEEYQTGCSPQNSKCDSGDTWSAAASDMNDRSPVDSIREEDLRQAPHITRRLLELETSRCWRSRKLQFSDVPLAIHYSSFCVLTRLALQERASRSSSVSAG